MPTPIEAATRLFADAGPFVTYYAIASLTTKSTGCFAASGVGLVGSVADFINSHFNPALPWPRVLNTSECILYFSMAVTFYADKQCSMWANFLQLAGISLALASGLLLSGTAFMTELLPDASKDAAKVSIVLKYHNSAILMAFRIGLDPCTCPSVFQHDAPCTCCASLQSLHQQSSERYS